MVATRWLSVVVLAAVALPSRANVASAQDDPFADEDVGDEAPTADAEPAPEAELEPEEPERGRGSECRRRIQTGPSP
jgi:hypothetical protein